MNSNDKVILEKLSVNDANIFSQSDLKTFPN